MTTDNRHANKPDAPQFVISPEAISFSQQKVDDEIDLAELWRAIWAGKVTIILITMLFTICAIFYALSKPNIYKASVLLASATSEGNAGGLGALAGQFGGLASMAGINLGASGTDKTALTLEVIKSRYFIENFIKKHEILVLLMAAKDWSRVDERLLFNEELYDIANKKWIREVSFPKTVVPSNWEAYEAFSEILSVSQNKENSLITVTISFFSPKLAKQWLIWLIEDLNIYMRKQDEIEAQNSINYLTLQLEKIDNVNMEAIFYQLIEEQTKNMMLTKVSAEYVLKTIDPAQVPEKKAGPKRALIVVLGTMLGGILSVLIVLVRYFTKSKKLVKPDEGVLA